MHFKILNLILTFWFDSNNSLYILIHFYETCRIFDLSNFSTLIPKLLDLTKHLYLVSCAKRFYYTRQLIVINNNANYESHRHTYTQIRAKISKDLTRPALPLTAISPTDIIWRDLMTLRFFVLVPRGASDPAEGVSCRVVLQTHRAAQHLTIRHAHQRKNYNKYPQI